MGILTPTNSMNMWQEAKKAFAVLIEVMYSLCTIGSMEYCDMVKEHEVVHGKSLVQAVDVVLTDRLHSVCRV